MLRFKLVTFIIDLLIQILGKRQHGALGSQVLPGILFLNYLFKNRDSLSYFIDKLLNRASNRGLLSLKHAWMFCFWFNDLIRKKIISRLPVIIDALSVCEFRAKDGEIQSLVNHLKTVCIYFDLMPFFSSDTMKTIIQNNNTFYKHWITPLNLVILYNTAWRSWLYVSLIIGQSWVQTSSKASFLYPHFYKYSRLVSGTDSSVISQSN